MKGRWGMGTERLEVHVSTGAKEPTKGREDRVRVEESTAPDFGTEEGTESKENIPCQRQRWV